MAVELSVVLPAKNEQGNIGPLIAEIHQVLNGHIEYEIVLTDDGSEDNTVAEAVASARQCGCQLKVLHHKISYGQSTAVYSAVRYASGRLIATLDSDGQNDPADLIPMLAAADSVRSTHFCIAGYRQKRKDSRWVNFQSRIANKVRQFFLRDGVPDSGCGLKIIPRTTFLLLPYFDHMHRFLPALIRRLNGEIVVHPVSHRQRLAGVSNYSVWNRLWVGIVDMFGVMWLRKRARWPEVSVCYDENNNEISQDSHTDPADHLADVRVG